MKASERKSNYNKKRKNLHQHEGSHDNGWGGQAKQKKRKGTKKRKKRKQESPIRIQNQRIVIWFSIIINLIQHKYKTYIKI